MGFFLCTHCFRHIKRGEVACPFCGGPLHERHRGPATVGMALLGLGVALAACSGSVEEGDEKTSDAATDQGQAGAYGPPPDASDEGMGGTGGYVAAYGPSPVDAADEDPVMADAAYGPPPVDAGEDVPSFDVAYGPPPVDAGPDADGGPDADKDGGMAGAYGPPPDSGH